MNVADAKGRRFDAATGIAFAVVALVGFALPGTPPKASDSVAKIASNIHDHRGQLLAASFVLGVAALLFVWFLGALRSYLRSGEGGEGRLSAAAFGGGLVGIATLLVGVAMFNGLVFKLVKSGAPSPDLTRAFYDGSFAVIDSASFGFAVFFAAASCSSARSGALPPWAYWSGSALAVLQLLGGLPLFVTSGFFANGGGISIVAPLAALVWIFAISALIVRREGVPPVPRAAP